MAAASPAPVRPSAAWRQVISRVQDRLFPPAAAPSANPKGILSASYPEGPALAVALAISVIVATLIERAMLTHPVTAGGDPGQWTSTAYAYVGLPYPSWIVPGQYPPLLFPLLGLLVRIGGGPILGARLYVGLVCVLLGLSTYFLARGLTRRRSTALLAEAVVLLNPTFLQMFFWGFYPNLLGLVFMNLTLAFLVRFVRSRRPSHAFLFWSCGAAALLTHDLVAVVLVVATGLVLLVTVSMRVLPREIYRSRGGLAGIGVLVASVGGYYGATALLKISHPKYLESGAFAYVRNGISSIFNLLVRPFVRTVRIAPADALSLLAILGVGLALYLVGVRIFARRGPTLGTILTVSMALSPVAIAAIGWELAVVTDYSRFSYFLVAPAGLAAGLMVDRFMTELNLRVAASTMPAGGSGPRGRWRPGRSRYDSSPAFAALTVVAVAVVVIGDLVSVQGLPKDEFETSKFGHDQSFLNVLGVIRSSGVPGSILTVPGVAKWTRAILVRDAYFPNLAARYTFDPSHQIDEETTYFVMTDRYTADTGTVALSALGTNLTSGNNTFQYQAAYYGVFTPVATLPIGSVDVTIVPVGDPLADASVEPVTSGATVILTPQGPGSYSLSYTGTGFVVTVTAVAVTGRTSSSLLLSVTADPGFRLLGLSGNLSAVAAGVHSFVAGGGPGTIVVTPSKFGAVLKSTVQVSPAAALGNVVGLNHPRVPAHAPFSVLSASGAGELSVGFAFSTPGAANLVTGLPPLVTADATFANWTVRFVLYTISAAGEGQLATLLANEIPYLESEYGAKVIGSSGPWSVVLLPASIDLPNGPRPVGGGSVPGTVVSPTDSAVEK